jgi:hypothetical protein
MALSVRDTHGNGISIGGVMALSVRDTHGNGISIGEIRGLFVRFDLRFALFPFESLDLVAQLLIFFGQAGHFRREVLYRIHQIHHHLAQTFILYGARFYLLYHTPSLHVPPLLVALVDLLRPFLATEPSLLSACLAPLFLSQATYPTLLK